MPVKIANCFGSDKAKDGSLFKKVRRDQKAQHRQIISVVRPLPDRIFYSGKLP
jgi:hypothetical protein